MSKQLKRLANLKIDAFKSTLFGSMTVYDPAIPRCAICAKPQGKRKLAADHCHATGVNRGKLCQQCNTGLGFFQDSPELLRNAIRYLWHYGKK